MLNVGASSPLNLHRKALQAKLNPSAGNSSQSVVGRRSFNSSGKSVTSEDHGVSDLEGGNNHHPHSIPQNHSLASLHTEVASSSRDAHDHDQNSPTVLNIQLACGGVYDSDRSCSRGRSGRRTSVSALSDSEEGNSRSSALSHKVCNRTSRPGDPSLNADPDTCFTVSVTVVVEGAARDYHKGTCDNCSELERRVVYSKKMVAMSAYCFTHQLGCVTLSKGFPLTLANTATMDKNFNAIHVCSKIL